MHPGESLPEVQTKKRSIMLQVRDFLSLFLNYVIEQDVQKLLSFKLTLASFYQKSP